jgi:hypothetical protein
VLDVDHVLAATGVCVCVWAYGWGGGWALSCGLPHPSAGMAACCQARSLLLAVCGSVVSVLAFKQGRVLTGSCELRPLL